jgi:carbon-monoxide dehydrogenase medium subunit
MYTNQINTRTLYPSFEYLEPSTLEETVAALSKYGDDAVILAGGTDLFVKMKQSLMEPKYVIRIKQPNFIEERPDGLHIGAATKLRTIEKSNTVITEFPSLYEATKLIGSVQIRCMATIGGNLCNASPAADTAPPLMVLGAKVNAFGKHGVRTIPVETFFVGPGKTVLEKAEILTEVSIPTPQEHSGTSFIRLSRASMDIAKISIAIMLGLDGNRVKTAKIALGSVAPTPILARESEKLLTGNCFSKELMNRVAQRVADEIRPITDIRSTAEYRKNVASVIARDALELAYKRAEGSLL